MKIFSVVINEIEKIQNRVLFSDFVDLCQLEHWDLINNAIFRLKTLLEEAEETFITLEEKRKPIPQVDLHLLYKKDINLWNQV